jgi:putative DNA primase/helicase
MEKDEVELFSGALRWSKPWRGMNLNERFSATMGVLFGLGDDVVTLLSAIDIKPKKVKWLWRNRIPLGKLTLFVGNPDNGKSMVATYVTATTSTGQSWFDETNSLPPSEVLIFANEDDHDDTTVPRLLASGANLAKVHFGKMRVDVEGEASRQREMRLDQDTETIRKALAKNPNIKLVVIDPISNHLGDTKMVDEQRVRDVLTPLQQLAAERSIAILGIMHLNKKADLQAIHRVGGATAFVGVARAVWLFCADNETPDLFHMLCVKKNISKRSDGLIYRIGTKPVDMEGEVVLQPCIEWIGKTSQSADAMLASKPAGRPRERDKASEWLKRFLADGPQPATEVERKGEAEGFKYRTLERAKDQSNDDIQSFRKDEKWYWRLTN